MASTTLLTIVISAWSSSANWTQSICESIEDRLTDPDWLDWAFGVVFKTAALGLLMLVLFVLIVCQLDPQDPRRQKLQNYPVNLACILAAFWFDHALLPALQSVFEILRLLQESLADLTDKLAGDVQRPRRQRLNNNERDALTFKRQLRRQCRRTDTLKQTVAQLQKECAFRQAEMDTLRTTVHAAETTNIQVLHDDIENLEKQNKDLRTVNLQLQSDLFKQSQHAGSADTRSTHDKQTQTPVPAAQSIAATAPNTTSAIVSIDTPPRWASPHPLYSPLVDENTYVDFGSSYGHPGSSDAESTLPQLEEGPAEQHIMPVPELDPDVQSHRDQEESHETVIPVEGDGQRNSIVSTSVSEPQSLSEQPDSADSLALTLERLEGNTDVCADKDWILSHWAKAFPHKAEEVATPDNQLQCGPHALVSSWAAQHPDIHQVSLEDLSTIFVYHFPGERPTVLSQEYLSKLISDWGRGHGYCVQLGITARNSETRVLRTDHDTATGEYLTLWILCSDEEDQTSQVRSPGHWLGLKSLCPESERHVQQPQGLLVPTQDVQQINATSAEEAEQATSHLDLQSVEPEMPQFQGAIHPQAQELQQQAPQTEILDSTNESAIDLPQAAVPSAVPSPAASADLETFPVDEEMDLNAPSSRASSQGSNSPEASRIRTASEVFGSRFIAPLLLNPLRSNNNSSINDAAPADPAIPDDQDTLFSEPVTESQGHDVGTIEPAVEPQDSEMQSPLSSPPQNPPQSSSHEQPGTPSRPMGGVFQWNLASPGCSTPQDKYAAEGEPLVGEEELTYDGEEDQASASDASQRDEPNNSHRGQDDEDDDDYMEDEEDEDEEETDDSDDGRQMRVENPDDDSDPSHSPPSAYRFDPRRSQSELSSDPRIRPSGYRLSAPLSLDEQTSQDPPSFTNPFYPSSTQSQTQMTGIPSVSPTFTGFQSVPPPAAMASTPATYTPADGNEHGPQNQEEDSSSSSLSGEPPVTYGPYPLSTEDEEVEYPVTDEDGQPLTTEELRRRDARVRFDRAAKLRLNITANRHFQNSLCEEYQDSKDISQEQYEREMSIAKDAFTFCREQLEDVEELQAENEDEGYYDEFRAVPRAVMDPIFELTSRIRRDAASQLALERDAQTQSPQAEETDDVSDTEEAPRLSDVEVTEAARTMSAEVDDQADDNARAAQSLMNNLQPENENEDENDSDPESEEESQGGKEDEVDWE